MPERSRGLTGKDAWILLALAAAAALLHARVLFGGEAYFTNDLTHVSFPWRVLTAEQLQRGQAPLWNPYAYFGTPLWANMQTGVLHPFSLLFQFFGFPAAVGIFLWLQHVLAAAFGYLWLRRWGFGRAACAAGAASFALGGYLVGYLQFPNLQSTIAHLPGLLLFFGHPIPLALHTALSIFAGYPPALGPMTAGAALMTAIWRPWNSTAYLRTAAGLALGLILSAAVLIPGAEFYFNSSRSAGMPEAQRLNNAVRPGQLAAIVSPSLARGLDFARQTPRPYREQILWQDGKKSVLFSFESRYTDDYRDPSGAKFTPWVSFYVGGAAFLLALAGLGWTLKETPLRAVAAMLAFTGAAVVVLGGHTGLSHWLWTKLPGLTSLRGPARLAFLMPAMLVPLIAIGVERLARARNKTLQAAAAAAAGIVLIELVAAGWGYYPTIARDYYREQGMLVSFLKSNPGVRYFQEPDTEVWAYVDKDDQSTAYRRFKEEVYRSYKQKLFGISNSVFHLPAGSGTFESMSPDGALAAAKALEEANPGRRAQLMPWAGIRYWMSRRTMKRGAMTPRGKHLWHVYEAAGSRGSAYLLPKGQAEALGDVFGEAPARLRGQPWKTLRERADRFRVWGESERGGTLYVAEPYFPGWSAYVNGKRTPVERRLGLFRSVETPPGAVEAVFLYRPGSWRLGCLISLVLLILLADHGRRRVPSILK